LYVDRRTKSDATEEYILLKFVGSRKPLSGEDDEVGLSPLALQLTVKVARFISPLRLQPSSRVFE
jgi:hypothetical protein